LYFVFCITIFILNKRYDFFSSFFEPESTKEAYQTEYDEEQRPVNETPEKIEVETDEVDRYPEKCLRNHIRFAKCDPYPDTRSEDGDVEEIEPETSHLRIIEHFCDINPQGIDPACEEDKEESELSIGSVYWGENAGLPLEQETNYEEVEGHTEWPEDKCPLFWFDTPHTIPKSKFEMKPDNVENSMSDRECTKWNNIGKGYREEKPCQKESFWITLQMIELSIERERSADEENSEEDKTLAENRKVFLYFWEIITARKWDNREECDEDELREVTERLPITGKKEDETCAQEESSENRDYEDKSTRASIALLFLDISEHDLVLFLCDDITRKPAIEESMDIHTGIIIPL
jgi:hypothetical protein